MILLYVLENFLAYTATVITTSDDGDALYVKGNLYNERPSLPYRTTAEGAQSICIDLGALYEDLEEVNFIGLFNHNFSTNPTTLELLACDNAACTTCTAAADLEVAPADACGDGCGSQPIEDFRNTWSKIPTQPHDHRYWKLNMDDTTGDGYYEIGELVLGNWRAFPRGILDSPASDAWVRLSPGRADGPEFFMGKGRTFYGQDWSTYYSECERFELIFTTQNDPCRVDDVHTFLKSVQRAGGRFVLIPDDTKPFCYYVIVENLRDYAERKIYGRTRELREWRFKLKSLTEGAVLL